MNQRPNKSPPTPGSGGKPPLKFSPSDLQHLKAAKGWIELGAWDVANDELETITPQLRAHPDVLKIRFNIYLMGKHFELATAVGDALLKALPEDPEGWIDRSIALRGDRADGRGAGKSFVPLRRSSRMTGGFNTTWHGTPTSLARLRRPAPFLSVQSNWATPKG